MTGREMTDQEKLETIIQTISTMAPEFKAEVLKHLGLGATGNYPNGKLDPTDQGELRLMISHSADGQIIRLDFGKPAAWIGLPKEHAVQLAVLLLEHAGAKLEAFPRQESLGDA